MKRASVASIALLAAATSVTALFGTSAYAADLPQRPAYKQPVVMAPVYNWTGCYLGGNIGAGWGRGDLSGSGGSVSGTNSGFAGGGQIGCDYQFGQWVFGIRDMLDGTSLDSGATLPIAPLAGYSYSGNTHWFDTLTARGGYLVQPNILLYAQGGVAWTQTSQSITNPAGVGVGQISNNTTGWTVGGGVEWMFVPHWSTFLEYNYMNFGTNSATWAGCGSTCSVSVDADSQNILVGINYKF